MFLYFSQMNQDHKPFFTADNLTYQGSKSGTNNMNDGSVPLITPVQQSIVYLVTPVAKCPL